MRGHPDPAQARDGAIGWARQALHEEALIIDFETTGFAGSEIVQVGVLDTAGAVLLETLVRPQGRIPARATQVHGITAAMVREAPTLPDLYDTLAGLLRGRHAVAYNAAFEQAILRGEAARHGRPLLKPGRWSCAMINYARYRGVWNPQFGDYRWHSLSSAAQQQGIPVDAAHSATGDCRMTLALMHRMAAATPQTPE